MRADEDPVHSGSPARILERKDATISKIFCMRKEPKKGSHLMLVSLTQRKVTYRVFLKVNAISILHSKVPVTNKKPRQIHGL